MEFYQAKALAEQHGYVLVSQSGPIFGLPMNVLDFCLEGEEFVFMLYLSTRRCAVLWLGYFVFTENSDDHARSLDRKEDYVAFMLGHVFPQKMVQLRAYADSVVTKLHKSGGHVEEIECRHPECRGVEGAVGTIAHIFEHFVETHWRAPTVKSALKQ